MVLCLRLVLAGECRSLAVCEIAADQSLPVSQWPQEDLSEGHLPGIVLMRSSFYQYTPATLVWRYVNCRGLKPLAGERPREGAALDQLL